MSTMVDINLLPPDELPIWKTYDFRCVACGVKMAVCLHEWPHKSKNPKWKSMPETRYPVCNSCHDYCHSGKMTSEEEGLFLDFNRSKFFPDWEQRLEQMLRSMETQGK